MEKTKELLNKSKNFIKGLFEKSTSDNKNTDLNIHGINVKDGEGDI